MISAHSTHVAPALGGALGVWEEELFALKRKVYTGYLALTAIVVAFVLVAPVAELEPRAQLLASIVIPVWIALSVGSILAMWRRPRSVSFVERMIYAATYPTVVGTGAVLMLTGDDPARQLEYFYVTSQWLPIAFIWSFIAFGTRRGLVAAGAVLIAFGGAVNLAAHYGPHGEALAGTLPAGVLVLSTSLVVILAMFVMWTFLERQTRGIAETETLARLATEDSLTGLPNRRALDARLDHDITIARRHRRGLAVCFIDLDDLKSVNDTYGHQGGDELILRYAERLRASVRAADLVVRVSGDEFVVTGFVGGTDEAEALARKLLGATVEPFTILGDHVVHVGASVGVSVYPHDALAAADLLRKADVAMYAAKLSGKGRWCMASSSADAQLGVLDARSAEVEA